MQSSPIKITVLEDPPIIHVLEKLAELRKIEKMDAVNTLLSIRLTLVKEMEASLMEKIGELTFGKVCRKRCERGVLKFSHDPDAGVLTPLLEVIFVSNTSARPITLAMMALSI